MGNKKTKGRQIGVLPLKIVITLVAMVCFSLASLVILYNTYVPVENATGPMGLKFIFFTHTISKLGRVENQPHGTWILWCLSMLSFGVAFLILISYFRPYVLLIRPNEKIGKFELNCRQITWICFKIGGVAVVLISFLPLYNGENIDTNLPHDIVLMFLAFLILGWLIFLVPMVQFIHSLQRSIVPIVCHYIFGFLLLGLILYWGASLPEVGDITENRTLIWGFWGITFAEWLTLLAILLYAIIIFWYLMTAKNVNTNQENT